MDDVEDNMGTPDGSSDAEEVEIIKKKFKNGHHKLVSNTEHSHATNAPEKFINLLKTITKTSAANIRSRRIIAICFMTTEGINTYMFLIDYFTRGYRYPNS